jgi:hypothetical protein
MIVVALYFLDLTSFFCFVYDVRAFSFYSLNLIASFFANVKLSIFSELLIGFL